MASGVTSIDELPTMNEGGGQPVQQLKDVNIKTRDNKPPLEGVSYNPNEFSNANQGSSNQPSFNNLPAEQIDKVINSIQGANTSLPSRDIPRNTNMVHQDQQAKPNYIPSSKANYIEEDNIQDYSQDVQDYNTTEMIYDEAQTPFIITVLYFIFQLPFVNRLLESYIPFIFLKDGNLSLKGYIIKSLLFGSLYYAINRIIDYLSSV